MLLERHGLGLGVTLLVLVSVCAWLLGWKAARQAALFREDHHERFRGKE